MSSRLETNKTKVHQDRLFDLLRGSDSIHGPPQALTRRASENHFANLFKNSASISVFFIYLLCLTFLDDSLCCWGLH